MEINCVTNRGAVNPATAVYRPHLPIDSDSFPIPPYFMTSATAAGPIKA